jgi:folate-binding protein YgfZ
MPIVHLKDRSVVRVWGEDAQNFLQGIVTCDLTRASPARFGALLTPQGKILFDFIAVASDRGFYLDTDAASAAELVKRLGFYKLRAKVTIQDVSGDLAVVAGWDEPRPAVAFDDPRLAALGWRALLPADEADRATTAEPKAYHARRIALGVPESGKDFVGAETFPHEADMDQLGGVDFDKGCYIGQEVVSRMQHRGTARTRAMPIILGDIATPERGAEIMAGAKSAGQLGSAADGRAIAIVRLDRLADALAAGEPITVAGQPVRVEKPAWARFAFPGEAA